MAEIEAYLCPDAWMARGIETASGGGTPLSETREEETGVHTVEVGLIPEGPLFGEFVELQASLCPSEASELACFLCARRGSSRPSLEIDRFITLVNSQREYATCSVKPQCEKIVWDWRLDRISEAYYVSNYLAGEAKKPLYFFQVWGVSSAAFGIFKKDVPKPIPQPITLTDSDLVKIIAELWDEFPGFFLSGHLNLMGGYIWRHLTGEKRGFEVVLTLAQGIQRDPGPELADDQPPGSTCDIRCVKKLRYAVQDHDYGVVFHVDVPDLCHLWKVELVGDIEGLRWSYYCGWDGASRCSGPVDSSPVSFVGARSWQVNTIGKDPIPGELFEVRGYVAGAPPGDCNPIILAWCYYTHPCLSSGKITRILLYDNGEIIEQRTSGTTPEGWIGDARLAYEVAAEGRLMILRPSDFYAYSVNERVFFHKGGVHTEYHWERPTANWDYGMWSEGFSDTRIIAGCQDPHERTSMDIFNWQQVRPLLNDTHGTIIPVKLYNVT